MLQISNEGPRQQQHSTTRRYTSLCYECNAAYARTDMQNCIDVRDLSAAATRDGSCRIQNLYVEVAQSRHRRRRRVDDDHQYIRTVCIRIQFQ